jgi:hypothetical protein
MIFKGAKLSPNHIGLGPIRQASDGSGEATDLCERWAKPSGERSSLGSEITIRRVLAADVESFRRLVERYQQPVLIRRKAAKVDVMRPSSLESRGCNSAGIVYLQE